ncbi:MAG: RNB domain-containing ribonuclease [Verrucomicrobiota bacterium]|nr:RNB domain-containing ribonuclease [Verrucomicrobiota bacterium]
MSKDKIIGVLYFGRQGRARVVVDGWDESISIARGASGTALHGDSVELHILPPKKNKFDRRKNKGKPAKLRYEVKKVVKRGTDEFLGYLKKDPGRSLVDAENSRLFIPFKILGDNRNGQPGDKVVAKFVRWDPPARIPTCKVIRVLGPGDDPLTDHQGILAKFGLSGSFPTKVEEQANAIGQSVQAREVKRRMDFRDIFTLTIDPLDARDFDDALSVQKINDDEWEIGVHIADVSYYVPLNSALDKEARKRGNSTYLVGEVVPMLPQSLSNGICSLVEGQDRLVKSVLFRFRNDGKMVSSKLAECVINSNKRLTYEQAILFLRGNRLESIKKAKPPSSRYSGNPGKSLQDLSFEELKQINQTIQRLWSIASKLRTERMRAGSLNLESAEIKILVDSKGEPEKILSSENDESHQLVEEFMLLANETVAKHIRNKKLKGIFRVHSEPDLENLDELRTFVALFGISCGELTSRKEVNKLLFNINKHPLGQVLRIKFLRSMKQACYRDTPEGHYGLAKRDYLHFTSPIRRYSDLVVHRTVEDWLHKEKRTAKESQKSLAKHLSVTERNSVDAERESVKDKLLLFYKRGIGQYPPVLHKAVITEIARKGFFIELVDTMARGFVPIRTLPRELGYRITNNGTALVGRNPKNKLKLGQEIKVVIYKVFTSDKQLDFKLA